MENSREYFEETANTGGSNWLMGGAQNMHSMPDYSASTCDLSVSGFVCIGLQLSLLSDMLESMSRLLAITDSGLESLL